MRSPVAEVVFSDGSLGGTSRSALQLGRAWVLAGYEVKFRPQIEIHPARLDAFSRVGQVVSDLNLPLSEIPGSIVHLHHGAWSGPQYRAARNLIQLARAAQSPPRLVTHNVFGVSDRVLAEWPTDRTVGVLGEWSAQQYRSSMGFVRVPSIVVIPNPQDTDQFRPPSLEERAIAREKLEILDDERVALRIGSPHPEKWSNEYVRLARANPDIKFLLVGAPSALSEKLGQLGNVSRLPITADEQSLREYYWAADVFAHIAQRGESFGNVLLEAILSGLPTVSLARPYRDNTPWEFQRLSAFHYAKTTAELSELTRGVTRPDAESVKSDRQYVESTYSVGAARDALQDGRPSRGSRLDVGEKLRVIVRHNPLVDWVKRYRLSHPN